MTSKEFLERVKKTIEKPEHWCKESFALTADNLEVSGSCPEAICWCVSGAINLNYNKYLPCQLPNSKDVRLAAD